MADSKVRVILSADDRTKAGIASAQKNLNALKSSAAGVAKALGGIALPALSVAGVTAIVTNLIQAGDELDKLAKRTNISVKELASLELIAQQSDTSLDALAKGINRLSVSLGEAADDNKEMAKAFKDLGVSAKDPIEALFQLADATKKTTDSNKTNADLMKVLSKSYQELLPLLREGGESLRESAKGSERYAKAMADLSPVAAAFNDNIATLRTELKTTIAEGTTPFIKALNDIAAAYVNADGQSIAISTWGERLGNALKGYTIVAEGFITVFKDVVNTATYGSAAISEALAGNFKKAGYWVEQLGLKYRETGEAYKKFASDVALGVNVGSFTPTGVGGDPQFEKFQCVADGGRWVNGKCVKKSPSAGKSDPLASLLSSTDIGRLKQFETQVALLNKRFAFGKKDAELYAQAMTKLVETTFAGNFKQAADDQEFWNMVLADGQETIMLANQNMIDWQQTIKDTQRDLIDMVDPVNALIRQLTDLDKFDGFIDPEVLAAARLVINEQIDALGNAGEKLKQTKSLAEELGLTFSSAFEDAIVSGESFRDILKGIEQDILRIITRKLVTEPLGTALTGFIGGLIPSANGNVFNAPALSAYSGSVVSKPTVFPFASGIGIMGEAGAEAILPLKRGRNGKLGVESQGGGGTVVHMHINTPDANSFRKSTGQITAQVSGALSRARRNM